MMAGRVPDLQQLEPWYTAHSRSIFDDLSLGGSLLPSRTKCCVRHPGSKCAHNLPAFFLRGLPPALSVYVPVHLAAMLLRLPQLNVRTMLTDSLRSATFLATYCLGAQSGCCAYFNSKLLQV